MDGVTSSSGIRILDLFDLIQKCTDLVLNGFVERRKTQA